MPLVSPTLVKLEQAILDRLNDNGILTKVFDYRTDTDPRKQFVPTVFCSIEGAEFTPGDDDNFFQQVAIFLRPTFKAIKNESVRRKGIYPVLEGIIQLFQLQNLGLGIQPIQPRKFQNVTSEEDAEYGEIIYEIELWTQYEVGKAAADPAVADLLEIAIDYFLNPDDDGEADASDLITG